MKHSRSLGARCLTGALAIAVAAFIPGAHGADLAVPDAYSLKDAPDDALHGDSHATIPASIRAPPCSARVSAC